MGNAAWPLIAVLFVAASFVAGTNYERTGCAAIMVAFGCERTPHD